MKKNITTLMLSVAGLLALSGCNEDGYDKVPETEVESSHAETTNEKGETRIKKSVDNIQSKYELYSTGNYKVLITEFKSVAAPTRTILSATFMQDIASTSFSSNKAKSKTPSLLAVNDGSEGVILEFISASAENIACTITLDTRSDESNIVDLECFDFAGEPTQDKKKDTQNNQLTL